MEWRTWLAAGHSAHWNWTEWIGDAKTSMGKPSTSTTHQQTTPGLRCHLIYDANFVILLLPGLTFLDSQLTDLNLNITTTWSVGLEPGNVDDLLCMPVELHLSRGFRLYDGYLIRELIFLRSNPNSPVSEAGPKFMERYATYHSASSTFVVAFIMVGRMRN